MALIAGVVLAGGRSARLGSEKAMARIGATPLVSHAAEVLANGCGALAVNAPGDSGAAAWAARRGLPVLPDRPGGPRGPLAGVLAALDWGAELGVELVAVAPCDAPALPRDLVARLAAGLAPGAGAAAARSPAGAEPACALWRVSSRPAVEAALAGGAHPPLREVLAGLGASEVLFEEAQAFADADTPRQLKALGGRAAAMSRPARAAAAALRIAAAVLLSVYAAGGLALVTVAVMVTLMSAPLRPSDLFNPPVHIELLAIAAWFALVVWSVPRLIAPPPPKAPPPRRIGAASAAKRS